MAKAHRTGRQRERHGGYGTPEYKVWCAIVQRCENPKHRDFDSYGGRGIRMCSRWRESFIALGDDVGMRPSVGHEIDRRDNEGHYSCGRCSECINNGWPANCRWITRKEQMNNTRYNHLLTVNGRTQSVARWAEEVGLNPDTLNRRVTRLGWSHEKAVLTPTIKTGLPPDASRFANSAVNIAVRAGRLPRVSSLTCQRCDKQAKGYFHHNGTDEAHHLDVIPLCNGCRWRAMHTG